MNGLETQIAGYVDGLTTFRSDYELPGFMFKRIDHIGIKAAGPDDFHSLVEECRSQAEAIYCARIDRRFIASARLAEWMNLSDLGMVKWVEIMEPRREKIGNDKVGLDHVEFFQPDYPAARAALMINGVTFEDRDNGSHRWLEATFGDGYEVKFNDKPLECVVEGELKEGTAVKL